MKSLIFVIAMLFGMNCLASEAVIKAPAQKEQKAEKKAEKKKAHKAKVKKAKKAAKKKEEAKK